MLKKIYFPIFFLILFEPLYFSNAFSQEPTIENYNETTPTVDFQKSFIKMIVSLAIVIVLMIITVIMLKKMMKNRQNQVNLSSSIKILEKRVLSPKSVLYIVEVGNEKILLSESQLEVRSHLVKKISTLE